MAPRRTKLAARSRHERTIIAVLRCLHAGAIAGPPEWTADDIDPFRRLVAAARDHDLRILSLSAPYLSEDERRTLAWMAHRQRETAIGLDLASDLDDAVGVCAQALRSKGILLPYHATLAVDFLEGLPARALPALPGRPVPHSGLAARVRQLVAERALIHTRDLQRLGISRQNVSRMVAQGVLVRAGYGIYMRPAATT